MLILCHKSLILLTRVGCGTVYLKIFYSLSSPEFQASACINRSRDSYSYTRNSFCTCETKPTKLHGGGELIGCGSVNSYLLCLAQGWGSKEEGLVPYTSSSGI
jgi:hypothetical protein